MQTKQSNGQAMARFTELTEHEAQGVTGGNGPVGVYYDLEKKQYILTDRPFYQPGTIFVGTL